jgi:tetratricopeptide (TPR) repeat protein
VRRARALAVALLLAGCAASPPSRDSLTAEQRNDLGVAHYQRGESRRALAEFERALALRPGWARALVNLGDARLALNDVPGAIDAYQSAVGAAPEDPGAANNLAWALLQDPVRWREAEPIIDGALAKRPEPRGYYLDTLGALRLRQGDNQAALAAFREALADAALRDPRSRAMVLDHAAEALQRLGDPTSAAHCRTLAETERAGSGAGNVSAVGSPGSVC